MIREYAPFAVVVVVMLAGWMLAANYSPSPAVLAAGAFVSAFVALGAGVFAAKLAWGRA